MSENIRYNRANKTVRQLLCTFSFYELEGEIDKVINFLQEQKESFLREYKNKEMTVVDWQGKGGYLDGAKKKVVTFDTFYLGQMTYYDDEVMAIWGERKMLPEEIEAIIAENKQYQVDKEAMDKREFDRMKKDYGW